MIFPLNAYVLLFPVDSISLEVDWCQWSLCRQVINNFVIVYVG